jgi:hypothetical protein
MVRGEYLTIDVSNLPAGTDEIDLLDDAGEELRALSMAG